MDGEREKLQILTTHEASEEGRVDEGNATSASLFRGASKERLSNSLLCRTTQQATKAEELLDDLAYRMTWSQIEIFR